MLRDEVQDKKMEKRKKVWTWLIIILLVASVGGFIVGFGGGGVAPQKYNGIKFIPSSQGGYLATIDGVRYGFNYHPYQVEGIFSDDIAPSLRSPFLYISYNPTSGYNQSFAAVQYYLADFLGQRFDTFVQVATTNETQFNLPIINCEDASLNEPVLIFDEANITQIKQEGNCIIITVENEADVYRVQDRLILMSLGVMQ